MPLICYDPTIKFKEDALTVIARANMVINEYNKKGFNLTLRQLYYVFVGNKLFPDSWRYVRVPGEADKWRKDPSGTMNATPNYDKLGKIIADGRMAGLVDWEAIVDRTRQSQANQHWARPSQILEATVSSYALDKWSNQSNYVEVWVEKEALEQVLARACSPLDVRFFACKGYTSASAMWEASERLVRKVQEGKTVHIIHLGDHDPSGVDMTRDIFERLNVFVTHFHAEERVNVHRIALNMDQIRENDLPPDPAKVSDPRAGAYIEKYGDESWELDALRPEQLVDLIRHKVLSLRNEVLWEEMVKQEKRGKHTLESICKYFTDVVGFLCERIKKEVNDSPVVCQGCGATRANPECRCAESTGRGTILLG